MSAFTNREKAAAAVREVAYRQRVYKRLVEQGKMKQMKADDEIRIMTEIADDYTRLAEAAGEPIGTLL